MQMHFSWSPLPSWGPVTIARSAYPVATPLLLCNVAILLQLVLIFFTPASLAALLSFAMPNDPAIIYGVTKFP